MLLALDKRLAPDEVLLVCERDREPDPRFKRVDLVVELIAGEDQAGLDPQDVKRLEAERLAPPRLGLAPDRVPDRRSIRRMAPDLVAELAGVASAGDDDREPVV